MRSSKRCNDSQKNKQLYLVESVPSIDVADCPSNIGNISSDFAVTPRPTTARTTRKRSATKMNSKSPRSKLLLWDDDDDSVEQKTSAEKSMPPGKGQKTATQRFQKLKSKPSF